MPKPLKNGSALAEASEIAETVVDAAIRYTDTLLFTNMDREPVSYTHLTLPTKA